MKSKEALDNLVHCKSITKCKECKHKSRCTMERDYNTINQELERLEMLETLSSALNKELDLKKELLSICSKNEFKLQKENEKLKKAIEWLKNTFEITIDSKVRISDGIDCIQSFPIDMKTNEVLYELLKEVLENE